MTADDNETIIAYGDVEGNFGKIIHRSCDRLQPRNQSLII